MLFNSAQFLIFFPVVTLIYFLIPHRYRWLHLLVASCIFYMAFVPVYIFILFFTIVIDYIAGILIENAESKKRRLYLMMSIAANVGVLGFFKYCNFFLDNVNILLSALHIAAHPVPLLNIILPIGLSFHTFQAMSYTIEVYRGNQKAERHFGIYALYVMFFPQLVAGPIERPQNIIHQFREAHTFDAQNLLNGLRQMLWGFFKKLVIADRLALYVNIVFKYPDQFHYLNLIIAAIFFTIQIYCDFSGYSDIALGAARVMGFELMINFRRPLISKKLTDLWQRWHISLTTWFTDYLYTPFVTDRRDWGLWAIYAGVLMTFLVSGLWHGAGWTYVIWGGLNGAGLIYEMLTRKGRKKASKAIPALIYTPVSIILTFLFYTFTEVFFRAADVHQAFTIISHIFTLKHTVPFSMVVSDLVSHTQFSMLGYLIGVSMTVFMFFIEHKVSPNMTELTGRAAYDIALCSFVLLMLILFGVFQNSSFIYFQF